MIEGPNGPGGIETVSVSVNGISSAREPAAAVTTSPIDGVAAALRAEGGVTQGELLRQEQRAGVVPAAQLAGNRGDTDGLGEEDEIPHARGPDEIGMEDTGPQSALNTSERAGPGVSMQRIDVEAAVGRSSDAEMSEEDVGTKEVERETPSTPKREAEEEIGGPPEKKIKEGEEEGESKLEDEDFVLVDKDVDKAIDSDEKMDVELEIAKNSTEEPGSKDADD
jgi:hypothetical protein